MIPEDKLRLRKLTGALALMLLFVAAAAGMGPDITPASLPNGDVSSFYSQTLTASETVLPPTCCTWKVSKGALPSGLSLSSGTGASTTATISGTPTTAGKFSFSIIANDGLVDGPARAYTITIKPALGIGPASLPSGEEGVSYTPKLTATGGTPGYTWSLTGALPSGVSFSNGAFSGKPGPGAAGSYPITVQVTDSVGGTFGQGYTVVIVPPPSVTTALLPVGEVGVPYPSTPLSATGGTAPYKWAITSGTLPAGMTFSGGILGGTPTAAGSGSVTFQVTDANGQTGSASLNLTVTAGPTITTPATLPNGEATAPYSQSLAASGGTPPYTWTITSGSLPAGLSLSSGGVISGTPTVAGGFNFTVQVADSVNRKATQNLSLTIIAIPTITTSATLPQGEVGAAYSQTLIATGGSNAGFKWSITAGSLPAGLSLSTGGVLSGTPTAAALGVSGFTVQVTDSANGTATLIMSITIIAGPTITTAPTLSSGTVGAPYGTLTLAASGGAPPYIWSITTGSLPAGLSLSGSTGAISGTPTASGTPKFTVQVTDAKGAITTKQFSITIAAGLIVTTPPGLPVTTTGVVYTVTISAAGGTPPYIWSISTGSLPGGMTLNSATGVISGTPASSGVFQFTVQVTDSASVSATKQFTLNVTQPLSFTTAPTLPGGAAGTPYSAELSASGGTPPYTWTITGGALPNGLGFNASSGLISGTPAATGTFSFTVQVTDNAQTKAAKAFTISIILHALPQVNIVGVPQTSTAAQQISFSVTLASGYPLDISGEITLSFQPDAVVPADDPAIQFSTGGRIASFTIPANTTAAVFSVPQISVQTGTVSGAITMTFTLQAGGAELPATGLDHTITIPRAVPAIQSVKMVKISTGFEIHVVCISTSRDLTEVDLTFTAAPGASLRTTSITENLTTVAAQWYQTAGSAQYGGGLMLVLPFTASQGSVDAVGSVSVALKNAQGSSESSSGSF
jgi:hypothetical protein